MASNPKSFLRKLMPTAHRVLLEEVIKRKLFNIQGKVLVIGAGHDPYKDLLPNATSILVTDISNENGLMDSIADAHDLPYNDNSFDAIIAIEVFEHLHSPTIAMKECYRVLSQHGVLIFSIPFMFHVHGDPSDYQRLTPHGILKLAEEFSSVTINEIGGRLAVISDILTTSYKFMILFRIVNNIFFLPIFKGMKSTDCASGYWVEAKKST
jgi:SAM-dependent methyltransferase